MAGAYTPGLKVVGAMRYTARRLLPISGDVLVKAGDRVEARQVVAETFMPGDITPLNLAKLLSMPPDDVPECMLKKEGERIEPGEVLARTKGIFGMFRQEYKSETAGTIESISAVTGQVIIRGAPMPVQVKAYLTGQVVEVIPGEGCVIEADVTFVQGIFGIGGETFGPIRMACKRHDQEFADDLITPDMKGCVVVGGARVTAQAIERARKSACRRLSPAASTTTISKLPRLQPRRGDHGLRTHRPDRHHHRRIRRNRHGRAHVRPACLARRRRRGGERRDADSRRRHAARDRHSPETGQRSGEVATPEMGRLEIGAPVRVIRDPYFGLIGRVTALPPEPRMLESGSKARVLEVTFESGEGVIIPRANVELIEGAGGQDS